MMELAAQGLTSRLACNRSADGAPAAQWGSSACMEVTRCCMDRSRRPDTKACANLWRAARLLSAWVGCSGNAHCKACSTGRTLTMAWHWAAEQALLGPILVEHALHVCKNAYCISTHPSKLLPSSCDESRRTCSFAAPGSEQVSQAAMTASSRPCTSTSCTMRSAISSCKPFGCPQVSHLEQPDRPAH